MTTEFNLTGMTQIQRKFFIWAYQRGGVFTMDNVRSDGWNVRTFFSLQWRKIVLYNFKADTYYLNPDFAREIRAKLETFGVQLRDYSSDFGAWFDAHLESARKPDPMDEPPADPEDTPILPMQPITLKDDVYTVELDRCPECGSTMIDFAGVQSDPIDGLISNFVCKECGNGWGVDDDEESRPEDGFLFNKDTRTAYFEDDYSGAFGGGGDPFGWMRHFRPRSENVRRDYRNGHRFMRRMRRAGVDKESTLSFVHDYVAPNAAFEAGLRGFVYSHYRDHVRYFNEYHWKNEIARVAFENNAPAVRF